MDIIKREIQFLGAQIITLEQRGEREAWEVAIIHEGVLYAFVCDAAGGVAGGYHPPRYGAANAARCVHDYPTIIQYISLIFPPAGYKKRTKEWLDARE